MVISSGHITLIYGAFLGAIRHGKYYFNEFYLEYEEFEGWRELDSDIT